MKKQTKYWIRFYTPGILFAETWDINCDSEPNPKEIEFPDSAYAFTIHKRTDIIDRGNIYKGKARQIGNMYYHPDSKVEDLKEVEQNPNATDTLIRNIKNNGWDRIIWTRWGNWPQPFDPTKITILERSK